ncbi:Pyridoxal phosphate-dependent decarboxylase [Kalmanozyma brasiliensis GHG001]|uniref:Glutamate decarboxylase n=1 Tax=Kalmanozyma brasiliensis (strain GHG001) TaxID=1365824 RepID=V5EVQ0_KALBG|nr:Pyridoxal phosphate-dependent decarboxylase [Kalmanozyma brasiliensis GHG001]EST07358.1 Pyridoxal phosphate-dependent decarboxylase [Kalmanozyma brasiliensis GHG001]
MSLSKHVDPDELIEQAVDHPILGLLQHPGGKKSHAYHSHAHAGRYVTEPIPKYQIPKKGTDAQATYQLINSDLSLDGKPTLNLASFVHTWMPDEATKLMTETMMINMCDQDEYPATMAIHARCVSMLADLWKAPTEKDENGKRKPAMGVATTGSSEAIMLACLSAKKRWQHKMKAAGKSFKEPGPNMVFGSNAQVAIEKFARYFDVEMRLVPVSHESRYCLDINKAMDYVDENTICVVVILGSTYTGHYEDVEGMSKLLDAYEEKTGIDIPIHVDGASGAMVAPFATPGLKWSFDIPRVKSINTSGHKFGMVYPGLGWVLFRDNEQVPKELVFELHYLGSVEYSFGLNFSRPAHPIIGQLFNFINLGFDGYRRVMQSDLQNARLLSRALENSGYYEVLSEIHKPLPNAGAAAGGVAETIKEAGAALVGGKEHKRHHHEINEHSAEFYRPGLPVVSFRWSQSFRERNPNLEQRWMQTLLRAKGWIVPNYNLSPDLEDIDILRVVVRENLSESMIEQLLVDIITITESLEKEGTEGGYRHLAEATSKHEEKQKEQGASTGHHNVATDKHRGGLPKGSGTKATGYAKQC